MLPPLPFLDDLYTFLKVSVLVYVINESPHIELLLRISATAGKGSRADSLDLFTVVGLF